MSALGHSLPMHSAPVLPYVGNGLKADVTGKGGTVKRLHALTRRYRVTVQRGFASEMLKRPPKADIGLRCNI
jgi:hypothetical protein